MPPGTFTREPAKLSQAYVLIELNMLARSWLFVF